MDGSLEKRLGDLYWSNADIISESAPVLNAPRADALVAFNLTEFPRAARPAATAITIPG